ncbi:MULTISPECIES: ATP-grasp domain-containing protein [Streptomyces]|uniref:Argininosuccinate lyase n=1 Tax=Streptomyces fradiae ATCC 10745 = DSM 40063 TaxID=1319510 RepID=A0A1Y2NXG5_STRFR|nr:MULTISPECIES: ATP-grasp domain-containing protein [Streptomyces]KAF0647937.1 argininosuccinate lyase [Streptomyces fradiae ATCC 10745 = DSM 40063]OSY52222.1 argininosuccinate lyase [Streptomyces fradiae ATCC 10745 = DSM 40063]QEV14559.1 ATP-grasp domain-containing protein [Streptomyces fradiae ATCC 10745 = DSM 40063]
MSVACLESLTFGLGHLVRAADVLGERLVLLTRDPSYYTYELGRLPADALDVVEVDTFDVERVADVLRRTPDLRGLISSTDTWTLVGAELAERLGLPGLDPAVLRLTRDKAAVRDRLYGAGLTRGRAHEVPEGREPLREVLLKEAGLPAVLKDTAGTGSQNVWLVRDGRELDAALAEAAGRELKGRLFAEPYFSGPVYSAETLTWAGRTRLLGVSSRLMSPEPYFREEITAFPVAFPEARRAGLERWLGEVLAAIGYTDRFAHVEFVLTADGPEVVEVNPRIGGALVGEGLCRALGVNVYEAMVEAALGRRPRLMDADLPGGPAVAFVLGYPAEPGVFTGVAGLDRLAGMPGAPAWYPVRSVGDTVEHLADSRGYAGIVYAEAETAELATHRAVAAANAVRVLTEPLPAGPPSGEPRTGPHPHPDQGPHQDAEPTARGASGG